MLIALSTVKEIGICTCIMEEFVNASSYNGFCVNKCVYHLKEMLSFFSDYELCFLTNIWLVGFETDCQV